jgi:hypothetical protein
VKALLTMLLRMGTFSQEYYNTAAKGPPVDYVLYFHESTKLRSRESGRRLPFIHSAIPLLLQVAAEVNTPHHNTLFVLPLCYRPSLGP